VHQDQPSAHDPRSETDAETLSVSLSDSAKGLGWLRAKVVA
jgi:hypothetical protein